VTVTNAAAADVFIDGTNVGRAPLSGDIYVSPGKHTVHARNGIATGHLQIDVKKGAVKSISLTILPPEKIIEIPPKPGASAVALYGIGVGAAGALLIGGLALAITYRYQEVNPPIPAHAFAFSTGGLIASGAVGIVTMTALYTKVNETPEKRKVTVAVNPHSEGLNIHVQGRF
jgi:hypothetical protein